MTRPRHDRPLRLATLGLLLVLAGPDPAATPPSARLLEIEPSSTWAGIARVHLEIEGLRQNGEKLEGTYQIRVPLSPSQNDTGRVLLHARGSIDELRKKAATVTGSAFSSSGQVNEIVVRTQPNGVVRIHVITPNQTLRFKTRYASRLG